MFVPVLNIKPLSLDISLFCKHTSLVFANVKRKAFFSQITQLNGQTFFCLLQIAFLSNYFNVEKEGTNKRLLT